MPIINHLNLIPMGLFDQAKDLYKLQKQAKEVKKQLKNIHIEAEQDGVTILMDGEQVVLECKINPELLSNQKKLESTLIDAFNKAVKKAQLIGAEKMKSVMGDLGV